MPSTPRQPRGLLFMLLSTGLPALAAAPVLGEAVSFVDDRGQTVAAPLQVCFVRDLATECHDLEPPAASSIELRPFDLLRAEGPEHGPALVRPGEIEELADGGRRVAVPRKARFRVIGLPGEPVTLSLYSVDDSEARQPRFRYELSGTAAPQELFVPAGDHLASLVRRGGAPDLHALSAPPGETLAIRYRDGTGWSIALRAVDPEEGAPVPLAVVGLSAPPVDGAETAGLADARTDALGFALFTGLESHLMHATVRHPEFVEAEVLGLSATPGTFDLRHVVLERGGTIEARVTVEGEPAGGASCRIVEEAGRDERGETLIETLREVEANVDGVCRIERVEAGQRFVRVVFESEGPAAVVDRDLQVIDGETVQLDLDLSPIRLSGTVFRGEERAGAGYRIFVDHAHAQGPAGTRDPSLAVVTDESGEYSGTLWVPSLYYVLLLSLTGESFGSQQAYLSEPTEEVDFHVSAREIQGRVVNRDGEAVEDALVSLRWRNWLYTGTRTDGGGEFRFPLESDEGEAHLYARRPWQAPSEPVDLTISPGVPIPPVTLTLPDPERIEGRLLSADGDPIPGGRVWSYRGSALGAPTLAGAGTTRPDGSFELPPAVGAPTWIYTSGPGCPLGVHAIAPSPAGEGVELRCAAAPAALRLQLLDAEGEGLAGRALILRFDGQVIPSEVLRDHLGMLGLPAGSDGRGRLLLAAVSPGDYDLYLADSSNEATVAQGLRHGFVGTTTLPPRTATDLELFVEDAR